LLSLPFMPKSFKHLVIISRSFFVSTISFSMHMFH
jgi:hypothetical protein